MLKKIDESFSHIDKNWEKSARISMDVQGDVSEQLIDEFLKEADAFEHGYGQKPDDDDVRDLCSFDKQFYDWKSYILDLNFEEANSLEKNDLKEKIAEIGEAIHDGIELFSYKIQVDNMVSSKLIYILDFFEKQVPESIDDISEEILHLLGCLRANVFLSQNTLRIIKETIINTEESNIFSSFFYLYVNSIKNNCISSNLEQEKGNFDGKTFIEYLLLSQISLLLDEEYINYNIETIYMHRSYIILQNSVFLEELVPAFYDMYGVLSANSIISISELLYETLRDDQELYSFLEQTPNSLFLKFWINTIEMNSELYVHLLDLLIKILENKELQIDVYIYELVDELLERI